MGVGRYINQRRQLQKYVDLQNVRRQWIIAAPGQNMDYHRKLGSPTVLCI